MTNYIFIALALVFVIEGLIYALFPEAVQRMMRRALEIPPEQLRMFGLFMALTGAVFVWLLQLF